MTLLPGRVAVLMDKESNMEGIQLPSHVSAKLKNLEAGPAILKTGTVIKSGIRELRENMRVAVMPILHGGLIVFPNDGDHPEIEVPEGQELWIYGPLADWPSQILLDITELEAAA